MHESRYRNRKFSSDIGESSENGRRVRSKNDASQVTHRFNPLSILNFKLPEKTLNKLTLNLAREDTISLIEDVYPVISSMTELKDQITLDSNIHPTVMVTKLLQNYLELFPANYRVELHKKDFSYFKIFKWYEEPYLFYFIPCDFLPELKDKDKELHDLFISAISALFNINSINLWDWDEPYLCEFFLSDDDLEMDEDEKKYYKSFLNGTPNEYLHLIINSDSNPNDLEKEFNEYFRKNSDLPVEIITFFRLAIHIIENKLSYKDFLPDLEDADEYDEQLCIERYCRFVWCLDDIVIDNIVEDYSDTANQLGIVEIPEKILEISKLNFSKKDPFQIDDMDIFFEFFTKAPDLKSILGDYYGSKSVD